MSNKLTSMKVEFSSYDPKDQICDSNIFLFLCKTQLFFFSKVSNYKYKMIQIDNVMAHRINGGRKTRLKTTYSGINGSLPEDVEEDEEERALGQYPMSCLLKIICSPIPFFIVDLREKFGQDNEKLKGYFTSDIDRLDCFEDLISEDFNSFQISGYFGSNSGAELHEMSILGVSDISY